MAKSVVINGVTYPDVPEVDIPLSGGGGNATFYETSTDDVTAGDVKSGVKFHGASGEGTGSMTVIASGADDGTISTKDGTVSIAAGYHDGTGAVALDNTEKGKLVTGNIKSGVTLFGVSGKSSVVDTEIDSSAAGASQILSGYKAYVNGSQVVGSMTAATVSQDAGTKVLSIS